MKQNSSVFDSFTNLYPVTKTLRFELKPIGKTLENMRKNLRWDEDLQTFLADQEIEDAYQVLKPVFDKIHEEFIVQSLENEKARQISFDDYFNAYKELRNELDKDKKKEIGKKVVGEEKNLREFFTDIYKDQGIKFKNKVGNDHKGKPILREDGYKVLTEAGILKYIKKNIDNFAQMSLKTQQEISYKAHPDKSMSKEHQKSLKLKRFLVEKSDLEKALGSSADKGTFDGFFSYLSGFNQNRENYYSTEDKATAVASRVISENLPKFCDNALEFMKRKNEYENISQFLKDKSISSESCEIDNKIFDIKYFNNCLIQDDIEDYNKKINAINYCINLYNQQQVEKGSKLRSFKSLFKQIGCGKKRNIIQLIRSNDELNKIIIDIGLKGDKLFDAILNENTGFYNMMLKLENCQGVYWSDKAINTISSKYFANWDSLKLLLNKARIFKKDKDEIKIPKTVELSDLFTVLDEIEVVFKEKFKENNDSKQQIIKSNDKNSIKLLKMIFKDIEMNKAIFEAKRNEIEKIILSNIDSKEEIEKDHNNQLIKAFLDSLLFSNQILKYFKVPENKIHGSPLHPEIYELLDTILDTENGGLNNPTHYYDIVRNYLTRKPQDELNKLKLNFENSTLGSGWDENKEKDNTCIILKDGEGKQYLAIMKFENTTIFDRIHQNDVFVRDGLGWEKMIYKLIPGANKTLPKIFFSKKWTKKAPTPVDIERIKREETFKKGKSFNKEDLHKLIIFYKESLKIYPLEQDNWNATFSFNFTETDKYESIDQFYSEVDKQGYKIDFIPVSKTKIDELVENGKIYLFEIYSNDSEYYYDKNTQERKKKNLTKGSQNLQTIYWSTVFQNVVNKPKLNGEAEIFYKSAILSKNKDEDEKIYKSRLEEKLGKKNDNAGKNVLQHKRFAKDKFLFHCPVTLNFGSKNTGINDEINSTMIRSGRDVYIIGIDRGEKHLAYYCTVNQNGEILSQGSLNMPFVDQEGKLRSVKAEKYFEEDKKEDEEWLPREVDCWNYNDLLDARASNRDLARKNWKAIGTIKELKDGYISQVVRKIVDVAIYKDGDGKELRQVPAYIVLENLNSGFKNSRKKIEKSVYQKLELALVKKLNFLVNKHVKMGEVGSVAKALQLTPPVKNFSDIEKNAQFGIMLYTRANYTSQTDPVTGWRKKIRFESTRNADLKTEISEKFDEIGFDGQDYYFDYKDENIGKSWRLWSGKNGKELDRFRWNNETRSIEQRHIVEELEKVFGKKTFQNNNLKSQVTENNVQELKSAIELIQQIRNTGMSDKDSDFILSPVRDTDGNHFDSRNPSAIVPNGDANGAYNIARKGIIMQEHIKSWKSRGEPKYDTKTPDLSLYVSDEEWDMYLTSPEKWKENLKLYSSRKAMGEKYNEKKKGRKKS